MKHEENYSTTEWTELIKNEILTIAIESPLVVTAAQENASLFGEPFMGVADGDDPIFGEYKNIIHPEHLTPLEALAKAVDRCPVDFPERISVISWALPYGRALRKSNYKMTGSASPLWSGVFGEKRKLIRVLCKGVADMLSDKGHLAVSPVTQPFYGVLGGPVSNWSERHIAYAAGLGTFGMSGLFITEMGVANLLGSVVTDIALPVTPRTTQTPYDNCLFHATGKCEICMKRCPSGAIGEQGHNGKKCKTYEESVGCCELCQTKVPCEFQNPTRKLKKDRT